MSGINLISSSASPPPETKATTDTYVDTKATGSDPDLQKLRKASQAMESYFVGMLLKKMHESASKGGLFEDKSVSANYRDMFDDAVATEIGKRGAFGIGDMLYRELSPHLTGIENDAGK